MDEKASFILEWQSSEGSFAALCKSFGISRTLGYRYVLRYVLLGVAGLRERSRAPRRVWNRSDPKIEKAIVRMRGKWPRIGPLKILQVLKERYGARRKLPAVSTIASPKRHGPLRKSTPCRALCFS